jgi:hypothetical protein
MFCQLWGCERRDYTCRQVGFLYFAALAEFRRKLISNVLSRAHIGSFPGHEDDGGIHKIAVAKLQLAMTEMSQPETKVGDL